MPSKGSTRSGSRKAMKKSTKRAVGAVVRRVVRNMAENKYLDRAYQFNGFGGPDIVEDWFQIRSVSSFVTGANPVNATDKYMNTMTEGASQIQRVGVKVSNRYIELKLQCIPGPDFAIDFAQGLTLKIALVLDRFPNKQPQASVLPTDIWNTTFPNQQAFYAQRNHELVNRFRVLREWVMPMSPGMICPCSIKAYVPLKNLTTEFSGATDNVGECQKGALTLWLCGTKAPANQDSFDIRATSRVVFKDV